MEQAASTKKRYFMLFILCLGATAIYFLPYLRWTYYDPLKEALGLTHTQFGVLTSAYGITSMIFYFPGGWLADRISARKLLTFAFAVTGLLGFYFGTYPSYTMCIIINLIWGLLATLTFWAALIKATRDLAGKDEQGKFFGLLEGGRGLTTVIISAAVLALFAKLGSGVVGLTVVINIFSAICVISAIMTWFLLEDSKIVQKENAVWEDIVKVIKMPAVWLLAIIVLTNYSVYLGSTYLTPYVTEIFGATVAISAALAIIRSYGLQLLGGPIGGFIADKVGSTTKVITWCYVLMAVTVGIFLVAPGNASLLYLLVVNMVAFGAAVFAMRGIYFASMEEVNIPVALTGSAVGFASMIGFTPDIYMNLLAGHLLDTFQGVAGYKALFGVMLLFVLVGLIASVLLLRLAKNKKNETVIKTSA
ncbi:MAG TPA: MFS transporter [Syntrophomonadaceae bacterium]|nr:MFS transporter [Syntrophomonadaceae bacterium]